MEEFNYILNMDVLGFGALVKSKSTRDVFDYYARIITGSAFAADIVDKDSVEVMVYSDTMAIKSSNKNKDKCLLDLINISRMVQAGQYYSALNPHDLFLPLRGTISYGEFIFHKGGIATQVFGRTKIGAKNISIIIGKPIVESYYFEKSMEIIGVALADSVMNKADRALIEDLVLSNLLVRYPLPLKNKRTKNGYLVNPAIKSHYIFNIDRLNAERDRFQTSSSEYDKYSNTISFFQHMKSNNLFYPNVEY